MRFFKIFFIAAILFLWLPQGYAASPAVVQESLLSSRITSDVKLPEVGISGRLTSQLKQTALREFEFSSTFDPKLFPIKCRRITANGKSLIKNKKIIISDLKVNVAAAKLAEGIPELENSEIKIAGSMIYYPESGRISSPELKIKIGSLPRFSASLNYDPSGQGSVFLKILTPEKILETAIALTGKTEIMDWSHDGNLSLSFAIKNLARPEPQLLINTDNFSISSPDSNFMADGIKLEFNGIFDPISRVIMSSLKIEKGEALYKTLYFDLNTHPVETKSEFIIPEHHAMALKTQLSWKNVLKLSASIEPEINKNRFKARVEIPESNISNLFAIFAVEPLSLENMDASGTMSCDFDITGSQNATAVDGNLNISNCNFNSADLSAHGISLKLPLNIILDKNFHPIADSSVSDPESGIFTMERLKAGTASVSDLKIPLKVSSRRITFENPPPINFSNGTLSIDSFLINNPFSAKFSAIADLRASGIRLAPLSPAGLPLSGEINGKLKCWLLKDSLSTTGRLTGKIYDGEVNISEIFANDPFSESLQYGADISIKKMDLAPLSTALDIGLITGKVDASLKNLVVAYGQPATFDLMIKSSTGKYKKEISLKAINSLSVIGTGSGLTGLGVGFFSSFFQKFSYKSLGMKCDLDNDLFKIRGLIKDNGVEYIIKRPIFFGVNVVNSNPDNLISFSDMLARIKRVSESENKF
ncbi:hypothetical protein [Maridesulfovibrio bastinii]|uniref:hypothetical protein n=1 Tax=Maridesulfovibrio bastinii TaxID=47157 RepID=UPI0012EB413D|nr:hypothetical protein [Maridesulfovibrio bastinii]